MTIGSATLDGHLVDVVVDEGVISSITPHVPQAVDVNANGLALFPGLCNMHSHAPMVLFRGLGDDQPLSRWLNDYIWPAEQKLDDDLVYRGTMRACQEMLASGTTFFNDMYFHLPAMARAVADSGIRARLGFNVFGDATELDDHQVIDLLASGSGRLSFSVAPHSIYTVSATGLRRSAEACKALGLKMHIHMSETEREVNDCMEQHGCRPWEWLDRLGVLDLLGSNIIAAHCLHLSQHEIELIGAHGITCVHCPNSNLKLGSGFRFPMLELIEAGATVAIGTDGAASSNNLDMLEATKVAALLQKGWRSDATVADARTIFGLATMRHTIAVGQPADFFLVKLNTFEPLPMPPDRTLSTLIYATHGESVEMTVVDGKVVYSKQSPTA